MSNIETLAVIIPVYNEEEIICTVINDWLSVLDSLEIDYTLNLYNDLSTDSSGDIMEQHKKAINHPRLYIHHNDINKGHGGSILFGYKNNLDKEWLFQVDSDNEMVAEHFKAIWKKRENYDFLLCSRIREQQNAIRKFISSISRWTVKLFYGKSVFDVNAPYRLIRTCLFSDFIKQIPKETFAPNVIISGGASLLNARVYEIQVPCLFRQTGTVSIKRFKLLKAAVISFLQTLQFRLTYSKKND